jgi:hypothetical protein
MASRFAAKRGADAGVRIESEAGSSTGLGGMMHVGLALAGQASLRARAAISTP